MRSLIIGSSGGLGQALATALRERGEVVALGRRTQPPLDLLDEASLRAAAAHVATMGDFERIVVTAGVLRVGNATPEKGLKDIDPEAITKVFKINTIGPALALKHFASLLPRRGRAVFAALSARVGSIGDNRLGGWYGYRASKAALNQILRTAAIEIARGRPEALVLALHPGTVATPLSAPFVAKREATAPAEAASQLIRVMDEATESGVFLDYAGHPVPW